jgi:hypothetical protein
MSKPLIHAESSVRRWGGTVEDYLPIHNLMDSSKGTIADSRHRALTHNAWFLSEILERIFGVYITNSAGRRVSVRDVGEQHVLEDYSGRFIPSAQDFLELVPMADWMLNGRNDSPPSFRKIEAKTKVKKMHISFDEDRPGDSMPKEPLASRVMRGDLPLNIKKRDEILANETWDCGCPFNGPHNKDCLLGEDYVS